MKVLYIIIVLLIIIYLSGIILIYFFQEKFIFYPSNQIKPFSENFKVKEFFIVTPDGCKLNCIWDECDTAKKTVLFFHGNAGNITYSEERIKLFEELGVNALLVDYRGYGKSSGKIKKEEDIYVDGMTAYKYLTDTLKIPENKIIVWGWSLGGGGAVEISKRNHPFLTILEGTFYSLADIAKKSFWMFPVNYILRYKFNNGEKLNEIKNPILIIHSPDDETIPYDESQKNINIIKGRKYFVKSRGDHNNGIFESKDLIIPIINNIIK